MKSVKFNRETITYRMTIRYAILMFLTLVIMSILILVSMSTYTRTITETLLTNLSTTLVGDLKEGTTLDARDLSEVASINENVAIIVEKNKQIIQSSGEYGVEYLDKTKLGKFYRSRANHEWLYVLPVEIQAKDGNRVTVVVLKNMDNEQAFFGFMDILLILLDISGLLAAILLGYLMSKKSLAPVDDIVRKAGLINVNRLHERLDTSGPDDELKRLAITLNQLFERVEKGYEQQNRFVMDASHELATPLAVISGYTDLMNKWGDQHPELIKEGIEAIRKENEHMTSMIDTLLALARVDNHIVELNKDVFDPHELMGELQEEARLLYKNHTYLFEGHGQGYLLADRKKIKQMLRALMDNAVKYSPRDTAIHIICKLDRDFVTFSIVDQGVGIPEEDIPKIFDRFYRVDKARSRSIGGSGLGLSMVKWIVDQHEGSIDINSEIDKGTTITITFPL